MRGEAMYLLGACLVSFQMSVYPCSSRLFFVCNLGGGRGSGLWPTETFGAGVRLHGHSNMVNSTSIKSTL